MSDEKYFAIDIDYGSGSFAEFDTIDDLKKWLAPVDLHGNIIFTKDVVDTIIIKGKQLDISIDHATSTLVISELFK